MTDNATLTRLRSLLAAATPGPWALEGNTVYGYCPLTTSRIARTERIDSDDMHQYDRALITAAVNALPALLRVAEAAKRCQPTKIGHMGHCQANARLDCTCGKYENDAELSKALAALEGGTHEQG